MQVSIRPQSVKASIRNADVRMLCRCKWGIRTSYLLDRCLRTG